MAPVVTGSARQTSPSTLPAAHGVSFAGSAPQLMPANNPWGAWSETTARRASPTCESAASIDLAWLRRRGMLKLGPHSLVWSWQGKPTGSISIVAQQNGLRLLYWIRGPNGERARVDELVSFSHTPTRFGSRRQWLTCPKCGRCCRRIFGGRYFRWRQCHGLTYASRNESPAQRPMHRADRIANRLHDMMKGITKSKWEFPPKPS